MGNEQQPSTWFDRFHAEDPLVATILWATGIDLLPSFGVERWQRSKRSVSAVAWHEARCALMKATMDAAAAVGSADVLRLENQGLKCVPIHLAQEVGRHCPRLTGQRVPTHLLQPEPEEATAAAERTVQRDTSTGLLPGLEG